ncbi:MULTISPECIES: hypothetical protein [Bacillus]|uniref:Uncharacterized protein n=1 Tax=Bacillus halotolerans TaxID=260554 RepID=A0A9Q2LCU7_9BACI|nr:MULTISPECIES: hypothetical protein [Bacillus]MBV7319408.1 hypothetical protein [Halalkalibacterium halodurans]QQF62705.1 hypothetical protein I9X38_20330 [Bacillus mojavensis]RDF61955.1 hypothetical protein DV997_21165 [Acinetobacter baumannii]AZV48409.1 hypothetical protein DIC78_04765 [Bacillus halotolerans]MBJ7572461.1 hypothetical protein [Bacillus halotolerans]
MPFIAIVNWELVQFVSISMINEYVSHRSVFLYRYSFPRCSN